MSGDYRPISGLATIQGSGERHGTPELALIAAVLRVALVDARAGDAEAHAWLVDRRGTLVAGGAGCAGRAGAGGARAAGDARREGWWLMVAMREERLVDQMDAQPVGALSRDDVYWLLRAYRFLDGPTGPRPASAGVTVKSQVIDSTDYPVARYAMRMAHINSLLDWLRDAQAHPLNTWAYHAIHDYYCDPEISRIRDTDVRAATVAGLYGKSVSTVFRWIDHGVKQISGHSGWRDVPAPAVHPFAEEMS